MIKFSKWLSMREDMSAAAAPSNSAPTQFDVKLQQQLQKKIPAGQTADINPAKAVTDATNTLMRSDPKMATQGAKALAQPQMKPGNGKMRKKMKK